MNASRMMHRMCPPSLIPPSSSVEGALASSSPPRSWGPACLQGVRAGGQEQGVKVQHVHETDSGVGPDRARTGAAYFHQARQQGASMIKFAMYEEGSGSRGHPARASVISGRRLRDTSYGSKSARHDPSHH
eukprot:259805-Pelagomonas_calceolata.AAC.2